MQSAKTENEYDLEELEDQTNSQIRELKERCDEFEKERVALIDQYQSICKVTIKLGAKVDEPVIDFMMRICAERDARAAELRARSQAIKVK